tara:strand:- start:5191 stop:6102 length:912 start_codon:yes stop_codon:yes gene_type:complete
VAKKVYNIDSVAAMSTYVRTRLEVLFEVWFPRCESVSLESILCKTCGFACYRPRPESIDIENKYTYLAEHEIAGKEFSFKKTSDRKRSLELYKYLEPYLGESTCSLLDYGGGNGRLLQPLLERGHQCSIVELIDETLPGISYLGNSLADALNTGNFDLIVCSHVLEHLVDPLDTVVELSKAIGDGGYMYIEVPHELWRRAPPRVEPVTHINFFSTDSLSTLLDIAKMSIVRCEYKTFTRPNGLVGIAVKALAQKHAGGTEIPVKYNGTDLALSQVNVSLFGRIFRFLKFPKLILNLFRTATPN